jgi:hypothetical protein
MAGGSGPTRVHTWRPCRVTVIGARITILVVVSIPLGDGGAQARYTRTNPPRVTPMIAVPNWSGYVATSRTAKLISYKSVTGTWTVPSATCAKPAGVGSSSVWVGLGGYATVNQEEVGTNSNCDKHGQPIYFAWFELAPYLSYQALPDITQKIVPGDTIVGVVKILSYRLVKLRIENLTQGWTFVRTINFSAQDTSTADWIMETPATCAYETCQEASLANFGTVRMRSVSAVGNGATGTLTDPNWEVIPIRLVPTTLTVPTNDQTAITSGKRGKIGQATTPAGATPGPFSADGSSFEIKWIPVARKDV